MGMLTDLAAKVEKALDKATKESKKVKGDMATVASIVAAEAPAVLLQVKRSATRVRERLEEAAKDAEAALAKKDKKAEKKAARK